MRRQRESVARMLCPMCGAPTATGDRWLQTARRVAAGALRARGFGDMLPADLRDDRVLVDAGAIAPCHLRCAKRAAAYCPHLQAHTSGELIAFPPAWTILPLMVKATPAHLIGPVSRAVPVVAFLQLCGVTEEHDAGWRSHAVEAGFSAR